MTPEQRAAETQLLLMHATDYWHEVDQHGGLGVAKRFFTEDGIFEGGNGPVVGHEAIEGFYAWRLGRGARTSRHVITNFRAEFAGDGTATSWCVMLLFAADGEPILPSTPPIMITDQVDDWVKQGSEWRLKRRNFIPLFQGGMPTMAPKHLSQG